MKTAVLILVAVLAGCTSSSTPSADVYSIESEDGVQQYGITCSGASGGWKACSRRAAEVCDGKEAKVLGVKERGAIAFICEAA
ncbi:hypothetical protein [Burkholderia ubonensis]|uniref:hypothetical protein n=1 Tax=Burkholderia ubonensis TaxID=101571 RepID=UPI000756CB09|nr:hypothetical protein [Burkholderia ubonensis]KUZ22778.1 hypothetical protein WI30_00740 [Burkholderia ubonensis]KUZ59518.1 hypothetical protein WI34_13675 [Burkholderia ubonensis]